ncbi:MAG TPA: TRAM domain-containing protein [Methanomassiliicoccales archaeon]|jgi:predicted RNA-binding protein with TRAM domain
MENSVGFKEKKPVEEGKTYTVTISDIGSQGDGVGKIEGFVIIVPDTKIGETVQVRIDRISKKVAFGTLVK